VTESQPVVAFADVGSEIDPGKETRLSQDRVGRTGVNNAYGTGARHELVRDRHRQLIGECVVGGGIHERGTAMFDSSWAPCLCRSVQPHPANEKKGIAIGCLRKPIAESPDPSRSNQ